jgi:hypothetical protein
MFLTDSSCILFSALLYSKAGKFAKEGNFDADLLTERLFKSLLLLRLTSKLMDESDVKFDSDPSSSLSVSTILFQRSVSFL